MLATNNSVLEISLLLGALKQLDFELHVYLQCRPNLDDEKTPNCSEMQDLLLVICSFSFRASVWKVMYANSKSIQGQQFCEINWRFIPNIS